MEKCGWSQAEVARRLHMTRGGVSQIVGGSVRPSYQTLALLKRIVAEEKPEVLAQAANEGAALSEEEQAVIAELRGLAPESRKLVIGAIRGMRAAQKSDDNLRKSLVQPLAHSVRHAPAQTDEAPGSVAAQAQQETPQPTPPASPVASSSSSSSPAAMVKGQPPWGPGNQPPRRRRAPASPKPPSVQKIPWNQVN